jgi:hypothetical protein
VLLPCPRATSIAAGGHEAEIGQAPGVDRRGLSAGHARVPARDASTPAPIGCRRLGRRPCRPARGGRGCLASDTSLSRREPALGGRTAAPRSAGLRRARIKGSASVPGHVPCRCGRAVGLGLRSDDTSGERMGVTCPRCGRRVRRPDRPDGPGPSRSSRSDGAGRSLRGTAAARPFMGRLSGASAASYGARWLARDRI